ncbi:GIY-YIG nuclease family protein [Moellerella wisconsensis]|uniref:Uncharacterized UPF0213 family protein n=1 Tax=Moellerella wisconsensis ATCC 35017 TaxID=1354267 RepID=A0A0N0IC60_9GAMM|nr:GIY-YIG nuclease family protein [Moellerella wisconsensis]KPD04211.1 uncharacterized UPF0213 family protein [Moellerella wisconsensis ATCC 35017]VFS52255.1 GIY-YIG nuclease superfamily protein [Moellerella wisconsensis]
MGKKSWYVYLIRANNDALYCGISTDVAKRIEVHQRGQGAKYLVGKLPLRLVYQAEAGDRSSASKIEYCIKQLKKSQKERLVIDQPQNIIAYLEHICARH